MRLVGVVTVAIVMLSIGLAWADGRGEHRDPFMSSPPKETVYATDYHMVFSFRAAVINWLGGVPIVDEREVRASEREKWWGDGVPLLPAEALKRSSK